MGLVMDFPVCDAGIDGVILRERKEIETPGGSVLHMLRKDDPLFCGFGELYFSEVLGGKVKAWKRHKLQTQTFAVPYGLLDIVLFDDREGSTTNNVLAHYRLGRPGHYFLLRIPPLVWYGFASANGKMALLANCADIPHDPEEVERLPADSDHIPYSWKMNLSL